MPAEPMEDAAEEHAAAVAPGICAIVPAYRAEAHLRATLESLRAQSVTDWRCVVVDDGSDDRTAEVAAQVAETDPRFRVVHREHGGISAARNTGLAAMRPDARLVTFLDADDVLLPDAFARMVAALEAEPALVGVQGLADLVDSATSPLDPGRWPAFQRERWVLRGSTFVPQPTESPTTLETVLHDWRGYPMGVLMLRRDAVDSVGPFDTSLSTSEDWDYAIRLCLLGDLGFLNEPVIHYRMHPGNHSHDAARNQAAARAVRLKAYRALAADTDLRGLARRAWRGVQREEAQKAVRRGASALRVAAIAGASVLLHGWRWLRGAPAGVASPPRRRRRSARITCWVLVAAALPSMHAVAGSPATAALL